MPLSTNPAIAMTRDQPLASRRWVTVSFDSGTGSYATGGRIAHVEGPSKLRDVPDRRCR